jgi:hypothetical protein
LPKPNIPPRQAQRLVRPSVDTGIKYRQDFVKQITRSLSDGLGLTRMVIDGLDLFYHDKSLHLWVVGDRHMKRIASISGSQRADYNQTRLVIKQRIAHDKGRATTLLLATRLRVRGDRDEVSLFRNVWLHLPDLSTDWVTPIRFFGFIAFRYLGYQFLQASFAPDASYRRYHNEAVSRGHVYVITYRNMGVFKYLLCKT